jgi:hypothetical protein
MTNLSAPLSINKPYPLVIVVSGPSGVGKDAILNLMKERGYPFFFMTTFTTRQKRAIETDGKDYHFVSEEEFERLLKSDGLLEWAKVYGNYYGVPKGHYQSGYPGRPEHQESPAGSDFYFYPASLQGRVVQAPD